MRWLFTRQAPFRDISQKLPTVDDDDRGEALAPVILRQYLDSFKVSSF